MWVQFDAYVHSKIEYELPENVKLIYLDKKHKIDILFLYRLFKVLRILKPNIIQSCISGVNKYILIYGCIFNFRNIIISLRSTKVYKEYRFLRFFNNINKIKCAIVNSNREKFELMRHSRIDEGSIHVIYNGIDLIRFKKTSGEKPVIVSYGANSDQIVKDKENGWLFDESNHENLVQIILDAYIADKALLQAMEKNNRKLVSNCFSAEKLVVETEKVYQTLLEKGRL